MYTTGLLVVTCSVMNITLYRLPHSTVFFSWLLTLCSELSVIWENAHSHAVCTHLISSTTYNHAWFSSGDKHCTFNLCLHQKTKKKGRNDRNVRGKSLTESSYSSRTHQIIHAMVCTCLKCML